MPLLADIAAHGLGRALESGRADHERRSIVQAWIAAGTREEPANTATRSAHPRSGNSSPGATLPMSGSIWPSSSSSTTYPLMGSSRSLRILPARLMLPWRRRSRRSLAPTQTARPGGRQETNVPRSGRKRQMSWRYGHRPPGRRPPWSAPGTTRPSAAALMTLLADTLSAELPAASPQAEQPPVCFPPAASWKEFWLPLRGPLPLVHRARQGHGDGIPGEVGKRCARPRVMRFWSKAVTRAAGIARA